MTGLIDKGCDTIMDVILHLGAHRTATTAFQTALRLQARGLALQGMAVWTPHVTRAGLFAGILPGPGLSAPARQLDRARGRIAVALARASRKIYSRTIANIVSDMTDVAYVSALSGCRIDFNFPQNETT